MHGYFALLNCVQYSSFSHMFVHPITGLFRGFQANNMDPCISNIFSCAINGESFPKWICCHGFLIPLLSSLVYFPFYCPLLLEGININELHNVVCTPLLTLVRVAAPYWAIISKAGKRQPQTISFTFLDSKAVPLKKCYSFTTAHPCVLISKFLLVLWFIHNGLDEMGAYGLQKAHTLQLLDSVSFCDILSTIFPYYWKVL